MSRFDYVKYDLRAVEDQAVFKKQFEELEHSVTAHLKPGRASALVLTKLEEAYMWVGKAIRDEQVARNPATVLQEERTDTSKA